MSLAAIILAAECDDALAMPAALLPWREGETLVEYHIEQLIEAGVRDIEIVLGCEADRIVPLVSWENVEPIVNERWAFGIASSLRAGASAVLRGTSAAIIVDVRQPRPVWILRAMIGAYAGNPAHVARAAHGGTAGAPTIVDEAALAALRNFTSEAASLDAALGHFGGDTHEVAFDTPLVLLSIATPEEYERARAELAG